MPGQLNTVSVMMAPPKTAGIENTTMVMNDCAKDPATFVPCIAKVQSIAELEKQCVVPLDEEGTEGDQK